MKTTYLIAILLLLTLRPSFGQLPPTGNDNQGGVSAPAGTFSVTPSASTINAYTANSTRVVVDLSVSSVSAAGLTWVRYGNTRITAGKQWLGVGGNWRHSFQWDFSFTTVGGVTNIQLVYPDGTTNLFTQTSPNTWTSTSAVTDVITYTGSTYVLNRSNNFLYVFTTPGSGIWLMTSIIDAVNQTTALTYNSSNQLTKVTEPGGNSLTLAYTKCLTEELKTWDAENRKYDYAYFYTYYINTITASDSRVVTYSYPYNSNTVTSDGGLDFTYTYADYIGTVTYPDSTTATYTYSTSMTAPPMITANDGRAIGIPQITYVYNTTTGAPAGAVLNIKETSSGTTAATVQLQGTNSQAPQVTYPDSSVYNYSVNAGGQLASVTNTLSAANTYAYTANTGSWTTTSTNANGNSVATTVTTNGKLTSRVWPKVGAETASPTEYWAYNAAGYLTSYTDTLGHTTTFTRAPTTNLVTSISYPDSTSESFTYNSFSEVLTHTRRNGGVEHYTYNANGVVQTEQDAVGNTTTLAHNVYDRISSITDANSHTTSFQYNDPGQTIQITHPDSTYQSFTYSTGGDLLTKSDELSHTTTYTYDGYHRVLTMKDPLNRTTTYSYSATTPTNSAPTLTTLPSGKKVSATYVAAWGYETSQITTAYGTSNPSTTSYGYDPVGNLTSLTNAFSNSTTFGYDARNRKAWAENPAGNEAMFYYDDASNLVSEVTPDGTTAISYDTMNRATQENDPKNQTSFFAYDAEGKIRTNTDPRSYVYTTTYDSDERPLASQYPDGSSQSVTYDPAGNILTSQTRDGRTQTFSYDNRNRNTGYIWSDGVTLSVTKAYDSASRVTSISNANSVLSYTFDNANEVLSETQNVTGLGSKTIGYTYTTDSSLNTLTYPDGTVLTYGYDNNDNVTSVQQGSNAVVSYTYDANQNRTGKNLANGVNSTLTYDSVQRLTSITDLTPSPTSGTLLQEFQYGYDTMSRRTYVKRNAALGDVYNYDATDQLTGVQYNCTNPDTTPTSPSQTTSYTYDAAGNRTQVVDSINGTTNYTANPNNQYTVAGSNAATYDGRGNLATFNGWTYTYDAQNLLIQAVDTLSDSVTQAYDPLGRCVKQVVNGVTSYFVYDLGWRTLADFNGSGTQTNRYVCGPSANEILTKTDSSGNVIYYHTDGLGSITKLTNNTGALIEQYVYNAFGQVTIENAAGTVLTASAYANRFLFTGAQYVAILGLYDLRCRFYSPTLGRFLQPDPIGHEGDSYNIFRYCGNDPINNIDTMGLAFSWTSFGRTFIIALAIATITTAIVIVAAPLAFGIVTELGVAALGGFYGVDAVAATTLINATTDAAILGGGTASLTWGARNTVSAYAWSQETGNYDEFAWDLGTLAGGLFSGGGIIAYTQKTGDLGLYDSDWMGLVSSGTITQDANDLIWAASLPTIQSGVLTAGMTAVGFGDWIPSVYGNFSLSLNGGDSTPTNSAVNGNPSSSSTNFQSSGAPVSSASNGSSSNPFSSFSPGEISAGFGFMEFGDGGTVVGPGALGSLGLISGGGNMAGITDH